MSKYCIKRILLSLFILFGISIILYFLVRMMPMNFVETKIVGANPNWTEADIQKALEAYGLADNSFGGICKGYWDWLVKFLQGDMGESWMYRNQKVEDVIFQNMGVSFAISFISTLLQLAIAIPLGIKCACNQYGKLDYTVTVLTMIGMSFPSLFFGSLLIKVFAVELGWFETGGLMTGNAVYANGFEQFMDIASHLVLPMVTLVILSIGSMMRYTRTNTLEVLNADYIRTARAKGLSEHTVIYKHVFRNTMIPLVTTLAGILPGLFGGAMITEQLFSIPGIGKKAYDALLAGDIPFIMGYNMFIAMLTIIGILLTDIMYAVVDPRVKLGK